MEEKTSKVTHQETMGQKLRKETSASKARKAKLRNEKAVIKDDPKLAKLALKKKKQVMKKELSRTKTTAAITAEVHQSIRNSSDDNVGVSAVNDTGQAVENGLYATKYHMYSQKLKKIRKEEKAVDVAEKTLSKEKARTSTINETENQTGRLKKTLHKRKIKKDYAKAKYEASKKGVETAGTIGQKFVSKAKDTMSAAAELLVNFVKDHPEAAVTIAVIVLLLLVISTMLSSCSMMAGGMSNSVIATSYTAEDADILAVEADYTLLETNLQTQIDNIRTDYPGYDEYNFSLAEIGHNQYELASYLTVMYENYTQSQVQTALSTLFDSQYELTIQRVVEVRYREEERTGHRTVHHADGTTSRESYTYTVTVTYNYYILNVTLTNSGLGEVVNNAGLTVDQQERYDVLLETMGNKSYLFGDDIYVNPSNPPGEYLDYDIPGEALTDATFAAMVQEAEKYLGYPYVWGGSSPSTSFDCSGFVSWVINHSGWNVGRKTANGLFNMTTHIEPSEAQPGDLIFFQGTYNTSGASHVGIYVGNGMMIHCGNPISYASVNTTYWQNHFYCYGRLP